MERLTTILLMLVVLPVVLFAGGVKIKTPTRHTLPDNAVMSHDSLQGQNWDAFITESGETKVAIYPSPVRWDSAGMWVRPDFGGTSLGDDFYEIKARNWILHYARSGAFRWFNKGGSYESTPANFDTLSVEIICDLGIHGFEQIFRLDENSPDSLMFRVDVSTELTNNGKGKGQVKNLGKLVADLGEVQAWDSEGNAVSVIVRTTDSTRTIIPDLTNAVGDVWIDPSVNDTILVTPDPTIAISLEGAVSNANWDLIRADVTANTGVSIQRYNISAGNDNGSRIKMVRGFMVFDLSGLSTGATAINSTTLFITVTALGDVAEDTLQFVEGTWTGIAQDTDFDEFTGWSDGSSGGAYLVVDYANELTLASTGAKSTTFTSAGNAAVLAAMDSDSLFMMAIHGADVLDHYSAVQNYYLVDFSEDTPAPYIVIDYGVPNPPGISLAVADSVPWKRSLYGRVDSTGGSTIGRGFQYYKFDDDTDTTTIVELGTFLIGPYILLTDSLISIDDSLQVRAFAHGPADTSYSAWEILPTSEGIGSVDTVSIGSAGDKFSGRFAPGLGP